MKQQRSFAENLKERPRDFESPTQLKIKSWGGGWDELGDWD